MLLPTTLPLFLSQPLDDVSRFGMILRWSTKNIGPAGLTLVIIREDLLWVKHVKKPLQYLITQYWLKMTPCLATPPTFAWYSYQAWCLNG